MPMIQAEHKTIVVVSPVLRAPCWRKRPLRLLEADPRVARIHLVVTDTGARLLAHELNVATSDASSFPRC